MSTQEKMMGNWNQLKGKVKQKWGQLTDDELSEVEGNIDPRGQKSIQSTATFHPASTDPKIIWKEMAENAEHAFGTAAIIGSVEHFNGQPDGIERALRELARLVPEAAERIELVDEANRSRPRTWT